MYPSPEQETEEEASRLIAETIENFGKPLGEAVTNKLAKEIKEYGRRFAGVFVEQVSIDIYGNFTIKFGERFD